MMSTIGSGRTALAWFGGGAALTLACIGLVDRPAATWTHETFHGAVVFVDLTHIVDPLLPLGAIGFLGFGVAIALGFRPGLIGRTLFLACVAVLLAVVVKDQLKYAFGRLWPETWVNNNPSWIHDAAYAFVPFHGGTGWTSFPSGHMTVITAPMTVLARTLKTYRWLAAVPVALVAIGLYGADYHFVGDMVAGTMLGALCALIVLAFADGAPGILR